MYIKHVIIDGFKSYGNRTEIGPFDSQFNAITGLNGTGKSNILDSICFVLGISNLSNVRATNLQDLVYKSGQAGVTKATVTIKFDNTNKRTSPLNYENYDEITVTRQIQIGGKNKYLINGVTVLNKRVIDFFISVQLNVNNPNFLIMQGRITKVLNMKPMEILSLIEEAAGTRSYENKREIANKTVEKKDDKLGEISSLINDEVTPRLEKLRADKALYLDYQKLKRDLDLYKRLFLAYRYMNIKNVINNGEKDHTDMLQSISNLEAKIKSHQDECENIEKYLKELQERNCSENDELKKMDAEIKEHLKKETNLTVSCKASKNSIKHETENLNLLQKSLNDDKMLLQSKETIMSKADETFQELKDADEKDSKALEIAEKRMMAISAGLSADEEGNTVSLQDQLIKAQGTLTSSQSLYKQYEMELSHYKNELSELEKQTHGADAKYKVDKNNLTRLQKDVESFKAQINGMSYSEEAFQDLSERQRNLNQEVRVIRSKAERYRSNSKLCFRYSDPEPNFDRRKVRGMLGCLLKSVSKEYNTALATCGAGRLFHIVVDTEETGKKLIKNGKVKSRITTIPLNKIQSSCIDKRTEEFAKNLVGAGNVHCAINLINYEPIDEPAMFHIFGGAFICKDIETARKVAFHPNIKRRCVALSGDVMDPSGTLTGGSLPPGPNYIEAFSEMDDVEYELRVKEEELNCLNSKLTEMSKLAEKYTILKNRIEVKNIELQTIERRLEQTDFHRHQEEIKKFKEKIESHTKLLKETKATFEQAKASVADLTAKLKDAKGYREKELKQAQTDLERAKKKSAQSKKNWQNREQEFQFMTIEISELKKSIEESSQQIVKAQNDIKDLEEKSSKLEEELTASKEHTMKLQTALKEMKNALNQKNAEMHKKVSQKENLEKQIDNVKLELKKAEQDVKKQEKDMEDSKKRQQQMRIENEWIDEEEHLFGKPGTCYDFLSHDMKDVSKKISQMSETKETMERNLNHKAMVRLANEESFYQGAVQKKELVETDQNWLVNTMGVLDNVKKRTIEKAYKQVNKDFGSIYSTLLPGTNARLQPLEGKSVLEGLEVKVAFNNDWKDSLSELSGGQRSLVALSLILAMLRYNPAPLYILDEVDAALDLSHTQNIGHMLKNHFKGSQFIIVSLKEGMFNNASVLFQTRNTNGLSSVIRTVQEQKKRHTEEEEQPESPTASGDAMRH